MNPIATAMNATPPMPQRLYATPAARAIPARSVTTLHAPFLISIYRKRSVINKGMITTITRSLISSKYGMFFSSLCYIRFKGVPLCLTTGLLVSDKIPGEYPTISKKCSRQYEDYSARINIMLFPIQVYRYKITKDYHPQSKYYHKRSHKKHDFLLFFFILFQTPTL